VNRPVTILISAETGSYARRGDRSGYGHGREQAVGLFDRSGGSLPQPHPRWCECSGRCEVTVPGRCARLPSRRPLASSSR